MVLVQINGQATGGRPNLIILSLRKKVFASELHQKPGIVDPSRNNSLLLLDGFKMKIKQRSCVARHILLRPSGEEEST